MGPSEGFTILSTHEESDSFFRVCLAETFEKFLEVGVVKGPVPR